MAWETPQYRDINMSAEIGAYQDDFEERTPRPPENVQQPAPWRQERNTEP